MKSDELTTGQAMAVLGIKSKITMRKYADKGDIPSRWVVTRSGRWRVFKRSDLYAFKAKMAKNPSNGYSYLPFERPNKKKPK